MTISGEILDQILDYDGTQLASLFAYRTAGVAGDSVIAFRGACRVSNDAMVDVEDLRANHRIESPDMLHFIAEHFGERLVPMILRQRLFARLAAERLARLAEVDVDVNGDDLFVRDRKASISVATVSPVSGLFHFGVNLETDGVPVPAIGLNELGVDWRTFAAELLDAYRREDDDVTFAAAKVRWVR